MTSVWWYLAICEDCQPRRPAAFTDRHERCEWAAEHIRMTGHKVIEREATAPRTLTWDEAPAA